MITACIEGDDIAVYNNGSTSFGLSVKDVIKFYEHMLNITDFQGARLTANITTENGTKWLIKKNDPVFGEFMTEATHSYLKQYLYPFAVYLNGVCLSWSLMRRDENKNVGSTIVYETYIDTTSSNDIFSLIEKSKNVSLELRDPNSTNRTRIEVIVPPSAQSRYNLSQNEAWFKQQLTPYRQALAKWSDRRVSLLAAKLQNAEQIFTRAGFEAGLKMKTQGWNYMEIPGRGPVVIYPDRIYVQQIWDGQHMWQLPEELKKEMYIFEITVDVQDRINSGYAKGFNPHCMGSDTSQGGICLGDCGGKPFSQIDKLLDQYKTVNMTSNYGGWPTILCEMLLGQRETFVAGHVEPEMKERLKKFEKFKGYCSLKGVENKKSIRDILGVGGQEAEPQVEQRGSQMEVWHI